VRYTFEIARTPDRFHALSKHPRVRPYVLEEGSCDLDLSPVWEHCIGFLWPEGGFLFIKLDDAGMWEIHTLFEDSRHAAQYAREVLHFMFIRSCNLLTTRVPLSNRRAYDFAVSGGMRDPHTIRDIWNGPNGKEDIRVLTLRPEQWMQECQDLEEVGADVHEALERSGLHPVEHGYDPVHERAVGFVAECFRAKVPHRGILYYNRWAVSSGYAPIEYVDPNTAKFGNVQVTVTDHGYEVSPCQSEPL
jgi:hypothetical protein